MPKTRTKSKKKSTPKACKKIAVYPGSFDPPTNGHINIIERGLQMFENIIVAVAHNTSKRSVFTAQERVELINEIFKNEPRVKTDTFEGLLVNYCKRMDYHVILRGLRTVSDFEFEFQIAHANKAMAPDVETVFMMTASEYSYLSSTIIKEIIQLGGPGKGMIPKLVERALRKKYAPAIKSRQRSKKRKA